MALKRVHEACRRLAAMQITEYSMARIVLLVVDENLGVASRHMRRSEGGRMPPTGDSSDRIFESYLASDHKTRIGFNVCHPSALGAFVKATAVELPITSEKLNCI